MRNNTDPVLVAGLHQHSCKLHLQCENRFRFTPIKTLKSAPRIWDRKPTTPLAARGTTTRKLWKRFVSARNNMKQLRRMAPDGQDHAVDESDTEINGSRNMDYFRCVKRRCMGLDDDVEKNSGHSFTETKWEFEASRRRRKLPAGTSTSIDRQQAKPTGRSSAKIKVYEDKDSTTSTPAAVRELSREKESKLVRSALRSSIDEDDAAVLNSFLSKAKAKRAAKEAEAAQNEEEDATHEALESGCETPPRRALDYLDANSPSPTKQQFPPLNINRPEDVPAPEAPATPTTPTPAAPTEPANNNETDEQVQQSQDQQQSTRPASRRRTRRHRSPKRREPPRQIAPPAIRNSASRETHEIEFILGTTNDQDLFIKTRANTHMNTGVLMRPKERLEAMDREERRRRRRERAEKKASKNTTAKEPENEAPTKSEQDKSTKSVGWKKKKFIEFDDGDYFHCYNDDSLADASTETDNEFRNMIPFHKEQRPEDGQEKDSSGNVRPPKLRRLQRGKKPS